VRANQVALGSARSTYKLAGIASDASRAAQQGAVSLVTSDIAGNLATLDLDVNALQNLGNRLDAIESGVNAIGSALNRATRRADGGIATAMALGGTVMPADVDFALSFNLATFRGQQGFSGSLVARISERVWVSSGIAGSTVGGSTGARAGITFGW
jgi:hypothetical protein